jgi:hypothetical protein
MLWLIYIQSSCSAPSGAQDQTSLWKCGTVHIFGNYSKKVKLSLCLTNWAPCHEGVWGSGCIEPHFLYLGTIWRWVVSFTHRPLYPREKSYQCPLDRRLGGPQSRSGRRWENSWHYQDSKSDPSLVRLRYPGSLGTIVTKQDYMHEDSRNRLYLGNACYHPIHSFCFLFCLKTKLNYTKLSFCLWFRMGMKLDPLH